MTIGAEDDSVVDCVGTPLATGNDMMGVTPALVPPAPHTAIPVYFAKGQRPGDRCGVWLGRAVDVALVPVTVLLGAFDIAPSGTATGGGAPSALVPGDVGSRAATRVATF